MNKLERFRFGNLHKKKMYGLLIILAFVVVLGLLFLALLGIFGSRSEYVSLRLNSVASGASREGVGINLNRIPSSNRVSDSNFSREYEYLSDTISDCSDSYIFFDSDSVLSAENVIVGSSVRVMTIDSEGVMSTRYEGLVNGFDSARFGLQTIIDDNNGYWLNDTIKDIVSCDGTVVAITDSGKLITDIASEDFTNEFDDTDDSFIDICVCGNNVYAITENGAIYSSADGRNFSLFSEVELSDEEVVQIAGVDNSVLLLTTSGNLYLSRGTYYSLIDLGVDASGANIVSTDDYVVLVTSDGIVYRSSNGFVFSKLEESVGVSSGYIDFDAKDNSVFLLNSLGRIDTYNLDDLDDSYSSIDVSDINPIGIAVTSTNSVIAITSDSRACLVTLNDSAISDLTSNAGNVDDVFCVGDRLIVKSGNTLSYATVLKRMQVNSDIPEDAVVSGDLCYIEISSSNISSPDSLSWESVTDNTVISSHTTTDRLVNNTDLRILGVDNGVHAVSIALDGSSADNFSTGVFYRLSLDMHYDGNPIDNVMVWISGEEFGDEGFTVENVSSNYSEYSYVFAITDASRINEEDTLYVNIAFEGDGVLFVDNVYLGEDRYTDSSIPEAFEEEIVSCSPASIRFNNLNFGSTGFSHEEFYGLGVNSLEGSLRLVSESNSNPWIVMGSCVDSYDVDCLLNYLCASVSSEYGKLRIDNGTAIPWSRQFDTIYIEITDSDNAYLSDLQKGAYVSYVKSLFTESVFYNELRGRIVFLDGMEYEGGVLLSSSDAHVSSGLINLGNVNAIGLSEIDSEYSVINYNVPRMVNHSDSGEYIAPMIFEGSMSAPTVGFYTSCFIGEHSEFATMTAVNIPITDRAVDTESDSIFADENHEYILASLRQISVISNSTSLYCEVNEPLDSSSNESVEDFLGDCAVSFVERDGIEYLIVSNASYNQHQFVVDGFNYELRNNTTILRYSSSGELITNRPYRSSDLRFTLQGGETLILVINENDQ